MVVQAMRVFRSVLLTSSRCSLRGRLWASRLVRNGKPLPVAQQLTLFDSLATCDVFLLHMQCTSVISA